MNIINNIEFYLDCRNAIIDSYDNLDIAEKILSEGKYSHIDLSIIEENLIFIRESIGDKIINYVSKKIGGGIDKLDKIISAMKDEELKFIKDENENESKYYKLSTVLAHLRKNHAERTEQDVIRVKLSKLEKLIKDLLYSHNSIMSDLEKEVEIIIGKNKRKSEYYNLKRAIDSVETKKMRAELKKKLVYDEDSSDYLDDIQKILGNPKEAENDVERAKKDLEDKKNYMETKNNNMVSIDIKNSIKTYSNEILSSLNEIENYIREACQKIFNKRINTPAYQAMKNKFDNKVLVSSKIVKDALGKIININPENTSDSIDKEKALFNFTEIDKKIDQIKFIKYPIKNMDNEKNNIINIINDIRSSVQKIA